MVKKNAASNKALPEAVSILIQLRLAQLEAGSPISSELAQDEKRAARGGSRELQGGVKQSGQEPLASIAGQMH